jgi:hypothetical protein
MGTSAVVVVSVSDDVWVPTFIAPSLSSPLLHDAQAVRKENERIAEISILILIVGNL